MHWLLVDTAGAARQPGSPLPLDSMVAGVVTLLVVLLCIAACNCSN
jgi:hypothetical protein